MLQEDQINRLTRLKELLDAGILNEEEFAKEKAEVLAGVSGSGLSEEQKALLRKIKELKDAGVLTEQEFREQKAQLLSQRAERNDGPDDGGFKWFVSSAKPSSPGSKKKNGSLLWIALGIVACIVIVVLAIAGSSHRTHNPDMPVIGADANQNGTVSGIRSNPYRDIDEYLLDKDNVYRDGTTVNYCDNEEAGDLGELIFGHLIRNPHTEIGKAISDMYRIEVLDTLLKKDPKLLHLISGNNLSLRYLWNGQEFYVFTPDEIKKRLQQY